MESAMRTALWRAKPFAAWAFLLLFGASIPGSGQKAEPVGAAPALPLADASALWRRLAEPETPGAAEKPRMAVIEGVPIVKEVEGLPSIYAAAASIVYHYDLHDPSFFRGNDRVHKRIWLTAAKDMGAGEDGQNRCIGTYMERSERYSKDLTALRDRNLRDTPGQAKALYLWNHGEKETGIAAFVSAMKNVYRERLLAPRIRVESATFESARSLIDNEVPFIIVDGDDAFVCCGYIEEEGRRYAVLGSPKEIGFVLLSRTEALRSPSPSDEGLSDQRRERMARRRAVQELMDQKYGKLRLDYRFSLDTAPATEGIAIVPWRPEWTMVVLTRPQPDAALVREFCKGVLRKK